MVILAIFNLGPWEMAVIALLALLLFGGKKLPSLAKDLGAGIKEFRKSLSAGAEETPENPSIPNKQNEETTINQDIPQKKSPKSKS